MATFATPDGTKKYAARFAGRAAAGHFREQHGLWLSSLGIGTYLGEPDARTDKAYTDAIVDAVESGVNVIDSAINYRFQRSERSVGAALEELARRGYAREELLICTKGGFLTPDGDMPADASEYFNREYVETGILREGDVAAGCHSMAPRFIADQLERSRRNLGVETIDVYYLHNPETQLGEVPREMFNTRVRDAFEFLESAVAAAKIHFYGLATWNAFRQGENEQDFLSLAAMESLARDVAGGSHHFRFVQLPVQPGDDGSPDARQPGTRRRTRAHGRSRVQAGHHAGGQRRDAAGKALARTAAVRDQRAGNEIGRGARPAICALDAGNHDGSRGHEPCEARARKSFYRGRRAGFAGSIFKIISARGKRVTFSSTGTLACAVFAIGGIKDALNL